MDTGIHGGIRSVHGIARRPRPAVGRPASDPGVMPWGLFAWGLAVTLVGLLGLGVLS